MPCLSAGFHPRFAHNFANVNLSMSSVRPWMERVVADGNESAKHLIGRERTRMLAGRCSSALNMIFLSSSSTSFKPSMIMLVRLKSSRSEVRRSSALVSDKDRSYGRLLAYSWYIRVNARGCLSNICLMRLQKRVFAVKWVSV